MTRTLGALMRDTVSKAKGPPIAEWRERRRPKEVRLNGVTLNLEGPWVTTEIASYIYNEYYEATESAVLAATLSPDDRYLEVGVGAGYILTQACQRVGARQALGIEANPAMADVARATLAANGQSPEVRTGVLTEHAGTADFYVESDFWTSGLAPRVGATRIEVPAYSLAEVLAEFAPSYLMVDIEGGEIELLAPQLPKSVRAICVELHPDVVGAAATQRLLDGLFAQGFLLDVHVSAAGVIFAHR